MIPIRFILPALLASFALFAQTPPPQAPAKPEQRRPQGPAAIEIAGRAVEVRVIAASDKTVRLSIAPLDGNGVPTPIPNDPAIVPRQWPAPSLRLRTVTSPQKIAAGGMNVMVTPDPLSISLTRPSGQAIQNLRIDKDSGAVHFETGSAPLYGLGQGGIQFDRRGNKHLMRTGSVELKFNGMRMPVPWLLSAAGWGMYLNRPRGEWDLTSADARYTPFPEDTPGLIDIFISAGDPPALMTEYAKLTGFPTMPPLWTLGYQQSHRTVWDHKHMMSIAKRLRDSRLPTDVLIYLSTGWAPSGWNLRNGSFDFNSKMFPNPERDIKELQSMNYKVVLHMVGEPQRLYGTVSDPLSPDADPNEARAYWDRHNAISRMGIDGWWPDVGERLSDASRIARIKMYWEGSQRDHPNVRPYALHRTGYAGMQRYGGWLWSGDVNSTWRTLKTHVAMGVNTGLSGVPLWGSDIGGFFSTRELTGELFVRWFQFGAFCPSFRSHGRPSQTRLPWGWNTGEYGAEEMEGGAVNAGMELPEKSELNNPKVEPIVKKYLELRYRLMPYLYSAMRETHETGLPIIRALWLHYPDDPRAASEGYQYLWGRDMLVAPVIEKGAATRSVYLPRGGWYDFWKETKSEGGREISREVDLETMPLYVRAGAILPIGPVKQFTAEKVEEPVTLTIFPGADGSFTLYEDDGATFNFEKGEFMKIKADWRDSTRELSLALAPGSKMLSPAARRFKARLAGSKETREITFSGRAVRVRL